MTVKETNYTDMLAEYDADKSHSHKLNRQEIGDRPNAKYITMDHLGFDVSLLLQAHTIK